MTTDPQYIQFTLDGRTITAEAGRNLVEVARENGVFLPTLCYFPHHDPPLGTCRVCTCRIHGKHGVACTEKVRAGLEVEITAPDLLDLRKALVEMMFAEGNHFCPACEKSGACDLQHVAYEMGMTGSRFPHLFEDRLIDYTPRRIVLEHNRCIKCRRCVEEVFTEDGKRVFAYLHRGNETVVGIDYEQEARLSEAGALAAMQLCPTGAIILRGVNQSQPFGDRRFDRQASDHPAPEKPPQPAPTASPAAPQAKKRIATASLAGCFGCHMSLLDFDTDLLDVIELVSLDKSPLTDIKQFSGRCNLGIIEGGCCNEDNVHTLRLFREHCDILVALGECAIWGGLPAMRNTVSLQECLEEAYLFSPTTPAAEATIPHDVELPKLLDKVYACHEVVRIDYLIPGCPPSPEHIWKVIRNLLFGEQNQVLYHEFKYD